MSTSNRRNFLKKAAVAGLAVSNFASRDGEAEEKKFTRLYYRDLGSTGYKATEIGFGAMNTRDAELVHAAIDAGINYLDTAHSYMNGANEEMIGTVMKTKRNKVFLVTKLKQVGADKLPDMLATSLKRLNTDHVDLVLLHIVSSKEQCLDQEYLKVFEDFKKQGLTRFIGVSTHKSQAEVLNAAVESKVWDAALVGYNFTSPPEVGKAIERARTSGMAIIAMKMLLNIETRKPLDSPSELRTGGLDAAQAALRWVLRNPYIDTTVPGMTSFEHLAADLAVMGTRMSFHDRRTLIRYAESRSGGYCRGTGGCIGCQDQCPYGVEICDLNRCVGYAHGYHDPDLALENYRALPASSRIEACGNCQECAVKCVNGLNLTETVRQARILFG